MSGRTIRSWLQRSGIALRPGWERRRHHLPPADNELRRCYLDEGLTTAQLAARYEVSATTAKRWLDKAGIPDEPLAAAAGRPALRSFAGSTRRRA